MTTFTGTIGDDTLLGGLEGDFLISGGGNDLMSGSAGADTYQITQSQGVAHVIIDDLGGDGAVDKIAGGRGLYQSASFGYFNWASFERVDDDLVFTLPGRPYRFRKAAFAPVTVEIRDHFTEDPVEQLVIGGTTWNLATGNLGTEFADILAGSAGRDSLYGYDGDDFISANAGHDKVWAGAGDDTVFGGEGRNILDLGTGNDKAFGGSGVDVIRAGDGSDWIEAGEGNNRVFAGNGDDYVVTGAGNDLIKGGNGNDAIDAGDGDNTVYGGRGFDTISVGTGDSFLSGGRNGDVYNISVSGGGNTTIRDNGDAASPNFYATGTFDIVNLVDTPLDGSAQYNLGVAVSGDDLVLSYSDPIAAGNPAHITVQDHFLGDKFAVEQIGLGGVTYNVALLGGDNRTYSVHYGRDAGGEDLVLGTVQDDVIYGGIGSDIMLGRGGADRYLFHDEDDSRGGHDIILDFDITDDLLDFTDIGALDSTGITITHSAVGNALITSIYGAIELIGITADQLTTDHEIFVYDGTAEVDPMPDPAPTPAPEPDPDPVPAPAPDPMPAPDVVPNATGHVGTSGEDVLKGGDGIDQFIFTLDTAFSAVDTIKDFDTGHGDLLDVSQLLIGFNAESNALSDFVSIQPDPEEDFVTFAVDRDGNGAEHDSVVLAIIEDLPGLTLDSLVADGLILA